MQKVRSSISAYNRSPTIIQSTETKTLEHAVNEGLYLSPIESNQ